jgi:(R,R)-butanediol dehydrogenase / meso-butanediol dehydrogenase / diacetyl reductase
VLVAEVVGVKDLQLADRDEPVPLPGTVVVEIARCGVSGADLDAWRTGRTRPAAVFGHEWVGRVVAIGAEVAGRFEGERVVLGALPPCGTCALCRRGDARHCLTSLDAALGLGPLAPDHGGFAPRIRIDARRLARLPEGLDDADAALAGPASVAAHAVTAGGQRLGDLVAVVGAGTIGLLTAEFARLAGARRVVAIERDPDRRELACSLGADAAFSPGRDARAHLRDLSGGLGADVVYDCAGGPEALGQSVELVRRGGRVSVLGVGQAHITLDPVPWLFKEAVLSSHVGFGAEELDRTLDLLAEDRLRVTRLHRHRSIGLSELPGAMADLADGRGPAVKALVDPSR